MISTPNTYLVYGSTSLMTASLQADLAAKDMVTFWTGAGGSYSLASNHYYTLTSVDTEGSVDYAHFRNPWGYGDPQANPVAQLGSLFIGIDVGQVSAAVATSSSVTQSSPSVGPVSTSATPVSTSVVAPTPSPGPGPDTIVVNASAAGVGAHFVLKVDGITIGDTTVNSTTNQAYRTAMIVTEPVAATQL